MATSDPDVARKLAAGRVEELERRRRAKHRLEIERESTLAEYAAYHLEQGAAARWAAPQPCGEATPTDPRHGRQP